MWNSKTFFLYLLGVVLLLGAACKPQTEAVKVDINNIPGVEVSDFVDPSDFFLIPLETNDQSLMGSIHKIIAGKENLFVLCDQGPIGSTSTALLVFNKDGSFLAKIGTVGHGPGEYLELAGFDIDDNARTIHLLDSDLRKVFVYTYDGGFVRELTIDGNDAGGYDIAVLNDRYAFMNKWPIPIIEEISVTDMQGKAQQKYLPRNSQEYSMVPMSSYYFYKMNGEVYFVPFCDDKIFKLDTEGNMTQVKELGLKSEMFPLEATMQEVTMGQGENKLAPIGTFVINSKGQYYASSFSHKGAIDLFGDIHKPGVVLRSFHGSTTTTPDLTFAMDVVGADGDYFIGMLDAYNALESYAELEKQNVNEDSNPVLVYFKFLPKTFED